MYLTQRKYLVSKLTAGQHLDVEIVN